MEKSFKSHEEYIIQFEGEAREKLLEMYEYLAEALPGCTEVISYSMPAFKHKKVLVYYAAFSKHIGFSLPPMAWRNLKISWEVTNSRKEEYSSRLERNCPKP